MRKVKKNYAQMAYVSAVVPDEAAGAGGCDKEALPVDPAERD